MRLPSAEDAGMYLSYYERNREHLGPWEPTRPATFYEHNWWEEFLTRTIPAYEEESRVGFGMYLKADSDLSPSPLIGVVNLSNIVRGAFQACHLGYSIDATQEGKGLMSEALVAALGYAFDSLRLHRVMANYQPTNERSAQLLRGLGFETEGFARDYLFLDGEWKDHVLTAKIRPSV